MKNRIIYLHGFQSNPQSSKAIQLKSFVSDHNLDFLVWIPQLPIEPDLAIKLCVEYIEAHLKLGENISIMGSSLGGFYSIYLADKFNLPCVVINPAIHPDHYIDKFKDELEKIVAHPIENWLVSYIKVIESLKVDKLTHPDHFLMLNQKGDELLDFKIAQAYFSQSNVEIDEGGCHNFEGFEQKLPRIFEFLG